MSDMGEARADGLRQVEQTAEQVAREAEGARQENERGTRRGQETDYAFRLPPDVAEADRVRAEDDVELIARQEGMAETQRRAAEALRRSAESLEGTAAELDDTRSAVAGNRADLQELAQTQQEVREQIARAREQIEHARIPQVEGGGGADGDRTGNG